MLSLVVFGVLASGGILLGRAAAMARDPARRLLAVRVLFAVYGVLLSLWLVAWFAHLFLPPAVERTLSSFAWWYTPFYTLGILIWALMPPRRRKLWGAAAALAIGFVVFINNWAPVRRLSDRLYVERHQAELDGLVADILAYQRIRSMFTGPLPYVNGTDVVFPGVEVDSVPWLKQAPLASVLERDSIDPVKHADFGRRLTDLHVIGFWADTEDVTLRRNRDGGLVYNRDGAPVKDGERVGDRRVVQVFTPHWYYAVW